MKTLKKKDRFVDLETEEEWTFDCKTRGPDVFNGKDSKPAITWTYVLYNKKGERRFIPEAKMAQMFRRVEA